MITTRNLLILCVLTAIVLPVAGCGGEKLPPGMPTPVPCEIIVMQEGKPLEGAVVRLHSENTDQWTAVGRTDATGKAAIYTADRYKGAIPGKYKVIVSKTEMDKPSAARPSEETQGDSASLASYQLVEAQFGMASSTTLEVDVVKGTPTYTVDAGKAVRIKIEEERR